MKQIKQLMVIILCTLPLLGFGTCVTVAFNNYVQEELARTTAIAREKRAAEEAKLAEERQYDGKTRSEKVLLSIKNRDCVKFLSIATKQELRWIEKCNMRNTLEWVRDTVEANRGVL